jgi:CRISPR/Cas system CMR-associated protein Cmr1 (group 7 of RAMP superfamily)
MSFKPTSDVDSIDPFVTKDDAEEYLRKMQDKFNKIKRLVNELEDDAFVCIIKTQKACQSKIDDLKSNKE